jgi:hypothetical protein
MVRNQFGLSVGHHLFPFLSFLSLPACFHLLHGLWPDDSEPAGHLFQARPGAGDILKDVEIYDITGCRGRLKLDGLLEIGLCIVVVVHGFGKGGKGKEERGEDEKTGGNEGTDDAVKVFRDGGCQRLLVHVLRKCGRQCTRPMRDFPGAGLQSLRWRWVRV